MELGRDVTDKQREILRLKSSLERLGKDLYPNKELETLQNKLDKCVSELEEEQERNRRLENKSKQLECEYRAMQIMLEDERLLAQERAEAFNKEISSLQEKLLQVSNGYTSKETVLSGGRGAVVQAYGQSSWEGDSDISLAAMRQQLTSLGDQLLVKQSAVQRLQSENVAVHAKLKDLQSRCDKLTERLQLVTEGEELEEESSRALEDGSLGGGAIRSRGRLRPKGGRKAVNDLERIGMRSDGKVAVAVDLIDSWTLVTGRFLRNYPLMRLGFVGYLLCLHLWALFILVLHTHALEDGGGPDVVSVTGSRGLTT
eukprot:gene1363-1550_t